MSSRLARVLCSSLIKTAGVSSQAPSSTRIYCSAALDITLPTHVWKSKSLYVRGLQSSWFSGTSEPKPPLVNVTDVVNVEEKRFGGSRAPANEQSCASEQQIMSEFLWKKKEYALEHSHKPEDIRRVMIIYSGGTLGMKWDDEQGEYGTDLGSASSSMVSTGRT